MVMSAITERLGRAIGRDVAGLLGVFALTVIAFGLTSPQFLSAANFDSMGFQLPELGLLTLAMLAPIVSGGINLAIIAQANLSGLALAWILNVNGGSHAGVFAFAAGVAGALAVGGATGAAMGATIAYFGAHPILASLAMMIFLNGLGVFLTRGGDISGFPDFLGMFGHGEFLGVPVPLIVFAVVAIVWHVLLSRTRHGFSVAMVGSNPRASEYSGIPVKRTLTLVYALSGVMCAIAGVVMLTRFNSVRVGEGEALLLVTVLACFLGGVDPFGGFGRVAPVMVALLILQTLSSGLNLIGASEHLATAVWGLFLIAVMVLRFATPALRSMFESVRK
jgi:simple sugar transport system permease protein